MEDPTRLVVDAVRELMSKLAKLINRLSGGKVKPSHITTVSILGHIPIAAALYYGEPISAAVLIIIFGLMDSLDGALARVQKTTSKFGMYYDATSDRLKEIIIYCGLAVYIANYLPQAGAWLVVAVAGSSLLVSYTKAKGEMAISSSKHDKQALNRAFSSGIARYEIRMAMLVAGLLFSTTLLLPILRLILALNVMTAIMRFFQVSDILIEEDKKNDKN